MKTNKLNINLLPNPKKVVLQFFFPGNENRALRVIERVQQLSDRKINDLIDDVYSMFSKRHKNYENLLKANFQKIEQILSTNINISNKGKLLIGSYFSKEYSIESAALFNPSIVPHFEQSEDGTQKFIVSLRATGEGHISSIEFREGVIAKDGDVVLLDESSYAAMASKHPNNKINRTFVEVRNKEKNIFSKEKLKKLPAEISEINIVGLKEILSKQEFNFISKLLDTNYSCQFDKVIKLNEKVLFPISEAESMGMEDVRFVKFLDSDEHKYFGTYTAYNGHNIQSQIIETNNFSKFKIHSMHGKTSSDKGMALFPKKIDGKYFMNSRIDGENMYMMSSEDLMVWNKAEILSTPSEPWEFIQIGNCGSPIEVNDGWLLLTHSVGPMRRYVMGAMLLDKKNPTKIKATLREPLLQPDENEREGYVPNVVYSCGSMIHNNKLIIPYAVSDSACSFANVDIDDLIKSMN